MAYEHNVLDTWLDLVNNLLVTTDIDDSKFFELYIECGNPRYCPNPPKQLELLVYNRHMWDLRNKRKAEGKLFKGSIMGYNTIMNLLNTYNKRDTIPPVRFIPLLRNDQKKLEFCPKCGDRLVYYVPKKESVPE